MDAPIPRVILSPELNHEGQNTHESGAGLNHSRERLHQHLFAGLQAPPFLLQDQKAVGQAHGAQHARALPPGHIDPQHPVVPTGNDWVRNRNVPLSGTSPARAGNTRNDATASSSRLLR